MNTQLEQKTVERIAKLQAMSRVEIKPYVTKMQEADDYDAVEMFQGIRRNDPVEMARVASTSYKGGSRINEINFNIAYEKYFGAN